MEKRFKNKFAVKGPQSLLKAFIEELQELGYRDGWPDTPANFNYHLLLNHAKSLNGKYELHTHNGYCSNVYTLPEDWNKALQAASETEKVIPEYVKITKGLGWYSDKVGKVYKLWQEDIDRSDFYEGKTMYIVEKEGQKSFYLIDKENCIPVTKEEYDKQQNSSKFKVGDFYLYDNRELRYIHKIEDGKYHYHQEIPRNSHSTVDCIERVDGMYDYRKVSDEEALELLKNHYAKQGVVEGAKVAWDGGSIYYPISKFHLRKNTQSGGWYYVNHGNSQLVIEYSGGSTKYITPTTEGFKIAPKEVKVAGYKAELFYAGSFKTIKVGCQQYTKDSLIAIRDLITHGIIGVHTIAYFNLSEVGGVKVTVDELNAAIKLFDQ